MVHSVQEAIRRIESIIELNDKIAYDHFTTPQTLPYAVYTYKCDSKGANDFKGIIAFFIAYYIISIKRKEV